MILSGDWDARQLDGLSKYVVRADGQIVSLWSDPPRVLVGGRDKDGYVKFVLIGDDKARRYVRRAALVCEAFHGPKPKGFEVRHLDGSRDNDAAANLAWSTHKENCADKLEHGTAQRGQMNGHASISDRDAVRVIELWRAGATGPEIMQLTGVSRSVAYGIKYGKSWRWLSEQMGGIP